MAAGDYNLLVEGDADFAVLEQLPMWQGGGFQEIASVDKAYSTSFSINPMW